MIKKLTNASTKMVDKYLPDPFLFALILTFVVYIAAVVFTGNGPLDVLAYWGNFSGGIWNLLKFSMQTSMIVVFGSAMAKTPAFTKVVNKVASFAHDSTSAIIVVTVFASLICWLNYGLGLIAGALLARVVARRVRKVDYRLLIASAYSGMVIWHQGTSGSIPLTISNGFDIDGLGTIQADITSTIFNPINLVTAAVCVLVLCLVNTAMQPDEDHMVLVDPALLEEPPRKEYEIVTPADKLEHSKIVWALVVIMGWAYIIYYFASFITSGKNILNGLERDSVNLLLLFGGILLHGDLRRYADAVKDSVGSVAGVILQYPFYAGIMAMMVGQDANGMSLAIMISNFFVSISNQVTFPVLTVISAGLVNFLVPSGGGQWTVQAPIVMQAAKELGVSTNIAAMAIAFGDQWTNMIQPFWALPALAVAGLRAKDIMGFMVLITIATGIVFCVGMGVWAFIGI